MSTPLNGKPITVGVIDSINQAYIARAFLESKGIHCFIKEEIGKNYNYSTLHSYELTELQVGQNDALKARTLLIENGYVAEEPTDPSQLMIDLDKLTSELPFIKKWILEQRIMAVAAIVLLILAAVTALFFYDSLHG